MFVADALGNPAGDRMKIDFIDNTDPDGIARALEASGRAARRDALRRHLQERRHAGNAQRHAAGGRGVPPGRP